MSETKLPEEEKEKPKPKPKQSVSEIEWKPDKNQIHHVMLGEPPKKKKSESEKR